MFLIRRAEPLLNLISPARIPNFRAAAEGFRYQIDSS
ncbi:hypothetical protein PFLUOLIPICF7_12295 [Pseudomonas simiae]|nr:hypothetical protein PFLUOLIPICF7_12295 [Pseudomonas simiae]